MGKPVRPKLGVSRQKVNDTICEEGRHHREPKVTSQGDHPFVLGSIVVLNHTKQSFARCSPWAYGQWLMEIAAFGFLLEYHWSQTKVKAPPQNRTKDIGKKTAQVVKE